MPTPKGRKSFSRAFLQKSAALLLLSSCAAQQLALPHGPIALAVAKRGWHTEIGVPREALSGPLANFGPTDLHRHYLLIGFGARAYFTGQHRGAESAAEALLPGPSAIDLAELDRLNADQVTYLYVSQTNINNLLAFVWQSMPRTGAAPMPIVIRNNANMFYAATPGYNMLYNCNNWAVDALRAAGLPFTNTGLHFSGDVQAQAQKIAAEQQSP
jgi:hypothetical protein